MSESLEKRIKNIESHLSENPQNFRQWKELAWLQWTQGSQQALHSLERALLLQSDSPSLQQMKQDILFHGLYTLGSPLFRHGDIVNKVRIAPNGNIVSASSDKTCRIWDLTGRELFRLEGHEKSVTSLDIYWEKKWVVTASEDGTCKIWSLETGEEVLEFDGHEDMVASVTFSPQGDWCLSGSEDETCRVWSTETGEEKLCFDQHRDAVSSVAISSDGRLAVSSDWTGTCLVWILESGKAGAAFKNHMGLVHSLRFSSDKRHILSAGEDSTIRLWDGATGDEIQVYKGHKGAVHEANFSTKENKVISCSEDRTMRLWDRKTGQVIKKIEGHLYPLLSVSLHPQGSFAVSCGRDQEVKVWNLDREKELSPSTGHQGKIWDLDIKGYLATVGSDDSCRIWDRRVGTEVANLNWTNSKGRTVSLSPGGKFAVVGGDDFIIRVWDIGEKKVVAHFEEHKSSIYSLAHHPTQPRVVSCESNGAALLWQPESASLIARIEPELGALFMARFFPSGEFIVLGAENNTCLVIDSQKGVEFARYEGHGAPVRALTITAGEIVASASLDNVIKLWEGGTGTELASLEGFPTRIYSLCPLGKSSLVAAGDEEGVLHLIDVTQREKVFSMQLSEAILCLGYDQERHEILAGLSNGCVRRIPQYQLMQS